jgi:hypothetical protein
MRLHETQGSVLLSEISTKTSSFEQRRQPPVERASAWDMIGFRAAYFSHAPCDSLVLQLRTAFKTGVLSAVALLGVVGWELFVWG